MTSDEKDAPDAELHDAIESIRSTGENATPNAGDPR